MVHHVIESVRDCGITNTCLVVGYQKESVLSACESYGISHATQMEQLGTGHAVVCALDEIQKTNPAHCLILAGDCPLIRSETLKSLIETHTKTNAAATILTATLPDAGNYGRIIRDQLNHILAIKEAKDCTPKERLIPEFNSGIYCFKTQELLVSKYQLMPIEKRKNWFIERNFNTHNQYVDIVLSYGIIGLLIFMMFIKELIAFFYKNIYSLNLVLSLILFLFVENLFVTIYNISYDHEKEKDHKEVCKD